MKALRLLANMACVMFAMSASADMVTLEWRHDIWPLSHTLKLNYDFGAQYELRFEKRDAGNMTNPFVPMNDETWTLSGSGTLQTTLNGLESGITYEIRYKVVNNSAQVVEQGIFGGVTPLPIPTFTPSEEPYANGGTTTFTIFTTEYGNPDWFDDDLMGNSNYETVLWITVVNQSSGAIYSQFKILEGAGNLSQETFNFELSPGQYTYCFRMTYAEVAGFGDFGPEDIMTTCLEPLPYEYGDFSTSVEEHKDPDLLPYPNPISDAMSTLSIKDVKPGLPLEIIDAVGATVMVVPAPNAAIATCDVSSLSTGAYFVKQGEQVVRFVKN